MTLPLVSVLQGRAGLTPHVGVPAYWPDLLSHEQFSTWLVNLTRQGVSTAQTINMLIENGQAIALVRAASLTAVSPQSIRQLQTWYQQAFQSGDQGVQLMALIANLHLELYSGTSHQRPDELKAQATIRSLEALRAETRQLGAHPLRWEVETRLLMALIQGAVACHDLEGACQFAEQLVAVAQLSGSSALREAADHHRNFVLMVQGQYGQAAAQHEQRLADPDSFRSPLERQQVTISLAIALTNLGNTNKALTLLEEQQPTLPQKEVVDGWRQWIAALGGQVPFEQDLAFRDELSERFGWQVQMLQAFSCAAALPPLHHAAAKQRQLYQQVLDDLASAPPRPPSDEVFASWFKARAKLLLGEPYLAARLVTGLPKIEAEDLLMRSWLAALHLELAASPIDTVALPLLQVEQELRAVMALARQTHQADAKMLAQMVWRWHPNAAAYAALMPDPIPEFEFAKDNIVQCRNKNEWRGQRVPPNLAQHLALRSLHLSSKLSLGGNAQFQCSKLTTPLGALEAWGPLVMPVSLIIALCRGEPEHRAVAAQIKADFGLLPAFLKHQNAPLPSSRA